MGIEIERKFLLCGGAWRVLVQQRMRMVQAYLGGDRCSVRVRIAGNAAFLNLKSRELGSKRLEFEYAVPLPEAEQMLHEFGGRRIEKFRNLVRHAGHLWEIDEFLGDNAGLVVAEIELAAENEPFEKPDWLGTEVTHEARYYNVNLASAAFASWIDAKTLSYTD